VSEGFYLTLTDAILTQLKRAGFQAVFADGHGPSRRSWVTHIPEREFRFGLKLFGVTDEWRGQWKSQMDHAARNRETVLRNAYMKAVRQTMRGAEDPCKAYVIPAHQHDPSTARNLVEKLLLQGIEIHVAEEDFVADDMLYGAGSYVIPSAQPKYGVVKSLLAQTYYPDNAWTREKDGSPRAPRDMATDTMPEFMGVKVDPVSCVPQAKLTRVEEVKRPVGGIVGKSRHGYALDCRQNLSYRAATALLGAGAQLRRSSGPVQCGGVILPAGAFIVEPDMKLLENVASSLGVTFYAVSGEPESTEVKKPRVGLYQRYYGGNADEGWTRFVLEEFGFEYETLRDEGVDEGLRGRLDVVVLPSDEHSLRRLPQFGFKEKVLVRLFA